MLEDHRAFAQNLVQQAVFAHPHLSQVNTSLLHHHKHLVKRIALDPRTYLPLISAASLVVFIVQFLVLPPALRYFKHGRNSYQPVSSSSSETSATLIGEDEPSPVGTEVKGLGYVKRSGGWGVVLWSISKLVSLIALQVLTILAAVRVKGRKEQVEAWCLVGSVGYSSILSLLSLTVRPSVVSNKTRALKVHLVAILLSTWAIYFVRDIYPLATFTVPTQDRLDAITWTRLGLLTFAAVIEPLFSPRTHIPVSAPLGAYEPTSEQTASIMSLFTFTFLDSLIYKAWFLPSVNFEQFPPLSDEDEAAYLRKTCMYHLDPGSKDPRAPPKTRHIGFRILRVWYKEVLLSLLLSSSYAVFQFVDVLGVNRLLHYVETHGEGAVVRPFVWVALIGLGPFVQSTLWNILIYMQTRMMVRMEAVLTLCLFEHALRIQPRDKAQKEGGEETEDAAAQKNLQGRISSLMSSDLSAIINARMVIVYGIAAPLGTVMAGVGLWKLLGKSSLLAMFLTVAQIPVPAKLTVLSLGVQKKFAQATDARVQRIGEAIGSLRITKLFGLESQVKAQIRELRATEMNLNKKRKLIRLGLSTVQTILPLITMIATFSWFTLVQKGELSAAVVFSAISVFNMFSGSMNQFLMLTGYVESWVSLGRINTFLQQTEVIDRYEEGAATAINDDVSYVGFHNATFAWLKDVPAGSEQRNFKLHFDGDVRFPNGKVSIVAGQTGSGKTSLLMALLGEMHFESRGADSNFSLPRSGGVAYASQQSWLQNRTLRDNILFGAEFDEERYNKVVKHCALERDFTLFDAGDKTEVGEKGLTLSGGQKARVTLARAIYSRASILLLDDILSALDVHTSKFIIDNLFKGPLIQDRTVILVTHHVGLASQVADFLVTLEDGKVKSQGSISELKRVESGLFKETEEESASEEVAAEVEAVDGPVDAAAEKKPDGKLVLEEEKAQGHISKRSLVLLAKALGGPVFWSIILGTMVVNQVATLAQVGLLGQWAKAYEVQNREDVNVPYYLSIYGGIVVVATITYAVGSWVWALGSVRSGVKIHAELLDAVFSATVRWLDSTPQGRIIARFVADTRTLDGELTEYTRYVLDMGLSILIKLFTIAFVVPIFGIAGLVIGAVGGFIAELYIHSQMSCKRESSNKKSPMFSHFGDAIASLPSVRAYDAEEAMKLEAEKRADAYIKCSVSFYNLNRWVNVRLDFLAAFFSTALAAYLIYGPGNRDASTIGFVLSVTVQFSSMLLMFVRVLNMWEVSGNSLERIMSYLSCEKEVAPVPSGIPPAYWPASGDIRIEDLSARYSITGPIVLDKVNLHIKSGERIGVVGRTGSGKSTLALALLRLIPTEGKVFIDGKDTSTLNLDALRSKVTIIPQDPTLFSGTLRKNIDPYDDYEDAALLEVMRASGLSASAEASAEGTSTPHHLTLTSEISAGGENLSQGQRQLVSLARGLIRRSKVFLLDEATASVDFATDALIQRSIRTDLEGVTLITIAHRLRTICDFDRILVLGAGKLIEFDTPANLLKTGGHFAQMVDNSPDADELRDIANGKAQ